MPDDARSGDRLDVIRLDERSLGPSRRIKPLIMAEPPHAMADSYVHACF